MEKSILNSGTIRGGIQLLFIVLGMIGVQVSEDEKMSVTETLVAVVGGLWALYSFVQVVIGRIKAKRDLKIGKTLL